MGELAKLPNIGPVAEQQLNDIGITNFKQLEEIGSKIGEQYMENFNVKIIICEIMLLLFSVTVAVLSQAKLCYIISG